MTVEKSNRPWYADGLAFECVECGRCCSGPEEGYVWTTPYEIGAAARHLSISVEEFRERYVRRVGKRFSLIEVANGDCIFLQPDANGIKHCQIYPVRPTQCRTWPFWPDNLADPHLWAIAQRRCPGINRGPLHDCEHIENEKQRTS